MRARMVLSASVCLIVVGILFAQDAVSIDWGEFPFPVRKAKSTYDSEVERIEKEYLAALEAIKTDRTEALSEAQEPLIEAVDKALKNAMQAENLNLALALKAAKEETVKIADVTETDEKVTPEVLLGTWRVRLYTTTAMPDETIYFT